MNLWALVIWVSCYGCGGRPTTLQSVAPVRDLATCELYRRSITDRDPALEKLIECRDLVARPLKVHAKGTL